MPALRDERDQLLRRWLRDYSEFVATVLRTAGTPTSELDDALQRTFMVAARRYADVRAGSERGFLLKTALYVAAHARRSVARRREVLTSELPESVDSTTPETLAVAKVERRLLAQLLERLGPELRTVLVLHELEQLTMAEIATTLRIAPGTVASRLRRARRELRQGWRSARARLAALGAALLLGVKRAQAVCSAAVSVPTLGVAELVIAAGGVGAAVAVLALRQPAHPPVVAPAREVARAVVAAAAPQQAAAAFAPERAAASTDERAAEPPRAVVNGPAPAPTHSAGGDTLRKELAQLDNARALLAGGRAHAALAVLDAYQRSTPRPALRLEAEVLRIDALSRSGRTAQARARAESFLTKYPRSVLAARVRQLAGR